MKLSCVSFGLAAALLSSVSAYAAPMTDAEKAAQIDLQIKKLLAQKAKLTKTPVSEPATPAAPVAAAQPAKVPSAFMWSGFYAGVHALVQRDSKFDTTGSTTQDYTGASYTDGTSEGTTYTYEGTATSSFANAVSNRMNFNGGAELGYNQQFDALVLGGSVDYTYFGANADGVGTFTFDGTGVTIDNEGTYSGTGSYTSHDSIQALETARLRLGVNLDRVMVFATGGVAFGQVNHSITVAGDTTVSGIDPTYTASDSRTKIGWAAGGGLEWAITDAVSLKTEYVYYDLGKTDLSGSSSDGSLVVNHSVKDTGESVRVGLNYHFD